MRDMTDNQFQKLAETRMAQMREWKAIPESKRPTWEEFKRGFKVKKSILRLAFFVIPVIIKEVRETI